MNLEHVQASANASLFLLVIVQDWMLRGTVRVFAQILMNDRMTYDLGWGPHASQGPQNWEGWYTTTRNDPTSSFLDPVGLNH